MLHKMKLLENPFDNIKNGTKTVEFRLNDEKRKNIKIGDKIEFSKLPELEEKIVVEVIDLYPEESFIKLLQSLYTDKEEIERKTNAIRNIYSEEQEKQYGVLGIKIRLVVEEK